MANVQIQPDTVRNTKVCGGIVSCGPAICLSRDGLCAHCVVRGRRRSSHLGHSLGTQERRRRPARRGAAPANRKLGRVFDLNCCSSELHKQPGERDNPVPAKARPGLQSRWVGGTTQLSNESRTTESPCATDDRETWGLLSNLVGFVIRIRILCILHVSCMYFACILM